MVICGVEAIVYSKVAVSNQPFPVMLRASVTQLFLVFKKPLIGASEAFFQADASLPPRSVQAGNIHQLTRGAIRFTGVKHQLSVKTSDFSQSLRQLAESAVHAGADVDVR